ncbi:hypothetical protein ABZT06_38520 [Streptomyces sp. NPDC005483]|uniref:hypothetical protein n=1 Tax=Streptomyces sp. NPDC005483 TaxID=3154882 RepID=UPI0033BD08BC
MGRGGNPGRVFGMGGTAVPPEPPRDADPVRASPVVGTGRIRKVVSEAVSAGTPVRRGGTEGCDLGRGGTDALPEFVEGDADGPPVPGRYDVPALEAGGIGPGAGLRGLGGGGASVSGLDDGTGVAEPG